MLNKKEIHGLNQLFRVRKLDLPYFQIQHIIIKGIVVKVLQRKDFLFEDSPLGNISC